MLPLTTILHPTDFSEHSEFAFRLSCALARDYKARLVLLHVISPSEAIYGGMLVPSEKGSGGENVNESLRDMEKSHWRLPCPTNLLLEKAREQLHQLEGQAHRIRVESQVMEGDPVDMILRAAKETNSDLIVMGTHGRTALARLLVGSVAESVLRKAPCPVLTSKPLTGWKQITEQNEQKTVATGMVSTGAE